MPEQPFLLKDALGAEAVGRIAASLSKVMPGFPVRAFKRRAMDGILDLELKDRVRHLVGVMHEFLPADFAVTSGILSALKENWVAGDPADKLQGFAAWPVIDYVGEHGLGHPEEALAVLRKLTPFFSAEFAIRPFIIEHPETAFRHLHEWTADPDKHVRRLVSEGSRPRLPWGQRLPAIVADPAPTLELLEKLKDDSSEYVRRSVANHLNDISKDHPETVIDTCRRWQTDAGPERRKVIRHATRTLVKAGHPGVFGLLGYTESPRIALAAFVVEPEAIELGGTIEFRARLESKASDRQELVVDYAVHHVKANGSTTPKVFKLRVLEIEAGESVEIVKRHAIRPISTRRYYPGEHAVEILVNGRSLGKQVFMLSDAG